MDAAEHARVGDFRNGTGETGERTSARTRLGGDGEGGVVPETRKPRMNAAEPLIAACAEGYSGKAGVPGLKKSSHGSHVGSASARSKAFAGSR